MADYGLTALIAYTLGADSLGAFTFMLIGLRFASLLGRFGLGTAGQKFALRLDDHELGEFVTISICVPLGFGLVVGGISYVGLLQMSIVSEDNPAVVLLLLTPLLALSETLSGIAEGLKQVEISVYIREFGVFVGGTIAVGIAIGLGGGLPAAVTAYTIAIAGSVIIGIVGLYPYFPRLRLPTWEVSFKLLSYGIFAGVEKVANKLTGWTDILMLGTLVASTSVGIYQLSYQTAALLAFALVSVNSIFPALASSMFETGDLDRLDLLYTTVTKWIFYLTLLGSVWLVMWSPVLFGTFGSKFADAKLPFAFIVVGQITVAAVGPAGYLLLMTEHERLQAANTIITALLNIVLNYVLIIRHGIIGAAIATTFSISVLNILRLIEVHYLLDIWPYSKSYLQMLPALILGSTVSISGAIIFPRSLIWGLGIGVASLAVFLLVGSRNASDEDTMLISTIR